MKEQEVLEKALDHLTELAGIALCGLAAHDDEAANFAALDRVLQGMESPWSSTTLQRAAFQAIIHLAGQAWYSVKQAQEHVQGEKLKAV